MDPGGDAAAADAQTRELRFEYANENRQATINLGATGVAILTFLLVFLYDKYDAGGWDSVLYRLTLGSVVLSIFFLGISGSVPTTSSSKPSSSSERTPGGSSASRTPPS